MKAARGTIAASLLVIALVSIEVAAPQAATSAPATQSSATGDKDTSAPQPSPPALQQTVGPNTPEVSSQEEPTTTFKVKVNLVDVRVVVRDAQGNAVGNLKQENFQLTDNGKPQVISKFSVEHTAVLPSTKTAESKTPLDDLPPKLPDHYIVYLFDDIHLKFSDLAPVRDATQRNLKTLRPEDRVAIFTTSGQGQLDFTDDREKLRDSLDRLQPHPISGSGVQDCPDVSYYMADQIQNKGNDQALQIVTQDAVDCGIAPQFAQEEAKAAARRELSLGDHETQVTLTSLNNVVLRTAAMPGQRSIILVSPGFFNPDYLERQTEVTDRALRAGVIINTLDARGLYTDTLEAGTTRAPSHTIAGPMLQYLHESAAADDDVLADLAYTTGGTFIRNTNDLEGGLRRLGAPPEYSYLLAFTPQNLKFDGRFHSLKVTIKGQQLNIQARKGYYAPKQAASAAEQARQQIQDEVFSQEELHDLPLEFHTQFFKTNDDDAKLSVVVRLDVQHLHYRKEQGRNNNSLTVVSVVFDRNGNYVSGNQKTLQMHWKDETLGTKLASGVTLKSSFDVKPGSYVVRVVVRDDEGQLSAQNGSIEIP
jgi:VWFA-related protein